MLLASNHVSRLRSTPESVRPPGPVARPDPAPGRPPPAASPRTRYAGPHQQRHLAPGTPARTSSVTSHQVRRPAPAASPRTRYARPAPAASPRTRYAGPHQQRHLAPGTPARTSSVTSHQRTDPVPHQVRHPHQRVRAPAVRRMQRHPAPAGSPRIRYVIPHQPHVVRSAVAGAGMVGIARLALCAGPVRAVRLSRAPEPAFGLSPAPGTAPRTSRMWCEAPWLVRERWDVAIRTLRRARSAPGGLSRASEPACGLSRTGYGIPHQSHVVRTAVAGAGAVGCRDPHPAPGAVCAWRLVEGAGAGLRALPHRVRHPAPVACGAKRRSWCGSGGGAIRTLRGPGPRCGLARAPGSACGLSRTRYGIPHPHQSHVVRSAVAGAGAVGCRDPHPAPGAVCAWRLVEGAGAGLRALSHRVRHPAPVACGAKRRSWCGSGGGAIRTLRGPGPRCGLARAPGSASGLSRTGYGIPHQSHVVRSAVAGAGVVGCRDPHPAPGSVCAGGLSRAPEPASGLSRTRYVTPHQSPLVRSAVAGAGVLAQERWVGRGGWHQRRQRSGPGWSAASRTRPVRGLQSAPSLQNGGSG